MSELNRSTVKQLLCHCAEEDPDRERAVSPTSSGCQNVCLLNKTRQRKHTLYICLTCFPAPQGCSSSKDRGSGGVLLEADSGGARCVLDHRGAVRTSQSFINNYRTSSFYRSKQGNTSKLTSLALPNASHRRRVSESCLPATQPDTCDSFRLAGTGSSCSVQHRLKRQSLHT